MRIAIVDDLAQERALLRERLERQLQKRGAEAAFREFERGEDFLEEAKKAPFAVAFLDIYMAGISGMETAKALREWDKKCLLVFTTTSPDHALEGFQVRAMQYLVKPFAEEQIGELVEEILSRLPRQDKRMRLKVEGSELELAYGDLVYGEHFAHMIYVHTTAGRTLATRLPFKTFVAPLREDHRFFVCGRGAVVNLEHASDFADSAFLLDDGSRVLVSQDQQKSARQAFMEFLLERGKQE